MNTLTKRIFSLFGIILISAVMIFSFVSCQTDDDLGNNPGGKEIPADLQGTEWTHTSGEKISFTKDSVTLTLSGGQTQTLTLKDTLPNDTIGQIILFFDDNQTKNTLVYNYNNNTISLNFNGILTNNGTFGWSKGSGSGSGSDTIYTWGDWEYKVEGSNVTIMGYTRAGYLQIVTVPSTIDYKPVTKINHMDNPQCSIKSVTIPSSVTYIEKSAIRGEVLTSITIGANVTLFWGNSYYYDASSLGSWSFNDTYYNNGKQAGTYTRPSSSNDWTRN